MYELVIKYAPNYLKESYVNMVSKNILSSPAHLQYEFQILVFVNEGSFHIEQDVFVKHNAPDNGQFQRRPRSQGKYFDTSRKILSQEMTMCNIEALVSYSNEVMTNVNFILKLVKCQGQKYLQKDLITRDIHVKYQSSNTHYSKVFNNIKVFKKSNSQVKVTR